MKRYTRIGSIVLAFALASALLTACGGDEKKSDTSSSSATESETGDNSGDGGAPAANETEVTGLPAEFPADVPVHPGTVVDSTITEITETATSYQISVDSQASYDDVVAWYQTMLPAGWSVGFFEEGDNYAGGREAKIALNGGDYTPAGEDGLGGGVLVGVVEGDVTRIFTTVTDMGTP